MSILPALAPAWIAFEILQLVISERYLGIKQMQAGIDPRRSGPGELPSFIWSSLILLYWAWMLGMLYTRVGTPQVLALIFVTAAGYALRRICALKWVLVVLTFEGAIRIGMLVSLTAVIWRNS